ncbi:hypothetical protein CLV92_10938 [Kineococcus xinjiangensis]|uniref:Uncharacterized protein n=1 Tax=Kineococcus xinjiangensis TaxID=512762 RepID=A0A2S6IHR5_9ACTN|nr:hypothetical protein [Kineococcus xinjiangensis]PPK93762.1 hypothetical protein CLV92_10938 [Kineococcus xinjiangensis]
MDSAADFLATQAPGAPARPWLLAADVGVALGSREARTGRVLLNAGGTARWWGGEPHEDAAFHRSLEAAAHRCGDVLDAARQAALAALRSAFEVLEGREPGAAVPPAPGAGGNLGARDLGVREHLELAADPALDAVERAWHWLAAERGRSGAAAEEARRWALRAAAPGAAVVLDAAATGPDGLAVELAVVDAATGDVLLDTLLDPHAPVTGDPATTHGLCDTDLTGAPPLAEVLPALLRVTDGRPVVAADAPAQRRLLLRSAAAEGLDPGGLRLPRRWEDLTAHAADSGVVLEPHPAPCDRAARVCRRERDLLLALAGRRPAVGRAA